MIIKNLEIGKSSHGPLGKVSRTALGKENCEWYVRAVDGVDTCSPRSIADVRFTNERFYAEASAFHLPENEVRKNVKFFSSADTSILLYQPYLAKWR